jgi:hypothetical protein
MRLGPAIVLLAGAGSVGMCAGLADIPAGVTLYLLAAYLTSGGLLYWFGCQDGRP